MKKNARFALLVFACLIQFVAVRAQGTPDPRAQGTLDPWYGRQTKPRDIDPPKVFAGAFSIELPKDWQLAPGHTGTIFSVVQKTKRWQAGALITLEYQRLQAPLEPALIARASEVELRAVQDRELSGKQFSGTVKTGALGPFVLVRYNRPGLSGVDDHVVQYSIPVGTTMYRLVCIAPATAVEKYRPVFAHVAASFTVVKPSGS